MKYLVCLGRSFKAFLGLLFVWHRGCSIIFVKIVLLNVLNHVRRNQISDTQLPPKEQSDLSRADVVANQLLNHVDVVLPLNKTGKCLIDIGSLTLYNEGTIPSKDMVQVIVAPDT